MRAQALDIIEELIRTGLFRSVLVTPSPNLSGFNITAYWNEAGTACVGSNGATIHDAANKLLSTHTEIRERLHAHHRGRQHEVSTATAEFDSATRAIAMMNEDLP